MRDVPCLLFKCAGFVITRAGTESIPSDMSANARSSERLRQHTTHLPSHSHVSRQIANSLQVSRLYPCTVVERY
jgi:hypothetical protein